MPRQKPYHKHLRTITTTGFAKTKTLPQAPANYHHHGFCQDKSLTISTCELSPPRVLPRQKPYHKHLRTITTPDFAKTKTLPQAPANYHPKPGFAKTKTLPQTPADYHHHGFCQDKNLTTSPCELSPPRVFAKTKTLPQAPANYHHHGFCQERNLTTSTCELSPPHGCCQDKNLTTSTCELSPPRVLPRQKPDHKHLRTITTTGFAKTKTLPQAPASYRHHGFCQDKNLTTSTCELSPPRVLPRQKPDHKHLRTITTTGFAKTKTLPNTRELSPPRVLPRQKTYHKHLRTITTTGFAKTKTLPPARFCQDKNLTTSTCELSPPWVLPRQKPYHKHLRTITTTGFAKTRTLPQAPANYHHHGFCQDENLTTSTGFAKTNNLTTSTCELSPTRTFSRQKPYHKHLRTITTTDFAETKSLPQAPADYHHHGFCQDKNLTTSTCELSPPRVLPRQKPYHKHLRTITTTGFSKTRTLPQAPANYHHHGFCQDKNLTTSTCELSPPRVLPRQKPYHKHLRTITTTGFAKTKTLPQGPANYHHRVFCQDKNLITSTCELSPPRVLPRQNPDHKHLRTITTTRFARTKTLPQAPANHHHHGFCQEKNLTTSTCELSPPRVLPRHKPYHKHLRTITTTGFAKTKTLPQAPANYHHHGFCQDKNLTAKNLRTITTTGFAKTKTLPQAPANYHHHGFCQDKNHTTSTCELSPPRVLPIQKPYHKHLRTITTTGFARTKTLPQAPANYHHHEFCQNKNLTTRTCELSPPRVSPRQKPYHKHLRIITTTGFAKTKTLPQARVLPRQKPYHKHLRTITATRFAKTKTLPQAPANYHHHGLCQDKNLTTSTCELSPPRVLPRQKSYHKHLRTITTTGFAKTKTLPQAPANYHHHGFCQDKNLTTSTCELSPPRVLPRQKSKHKHLQAMTATGFAKTKNLTQAPANYHHHGFCQDKNLTTSTRELSPPRFLPRQKPYHKCLRTITTTGFAKTRT